MFQRVNLCYCVAGNVRGKRPFVGGVLTPEGRKDIRAHDFLKINEDPKDSTHTNVQW